MITPESFIETKYFLKLSANTGYIDISGTVEEYAVTKAGKIPLLPQRNRDFTLKSTTFSFSLYSTTEIIRGMRFQVERDDVIIFRGFVDTVSYNKDKDEYSIKIAHEFKLLDNFRINKEELETIITYTDAVEILKTLFERVIDSTIDFSIAETYEPLSTLPTLRLGATRFSLSQLWCFGLDYASSEPETAETGTYWELFSIMIGLLGCVVWWDGTQYKVAHYTQETNIEDPLENLAFIDKYKDTYIDTKNNYTGCCFTTNYAPLLSLTLKGTFDGSGGYIGTPENAGDYFICSVSGGLVQDIFFEIGDFAVWAGESWFNLKGGTAASTVNRYETQDQDSLTSEFRFNQLTNDGFSFISNPDNLLPILNIGTVNNIGLLNISRKDNELNGQQEYINHYNKIQIDTDFNLDNNRIASRSYDPVKDIMSIEQHIPYDFEIEEYYYIDQGNFKQTLLISSELQEDDSVYVTFTKELDENALNFIGLYSGTSPLGETEITTTKTFLSDKTIKLTYSGLSSGSHNVGVLYTIKSKTQAQLPYTQAVAKDFYFQAFEVVSGGGAK